MLHGRNVSGVVGQRYSVCEEGQNERPLTVPFPNTSTERGTSGHYVPQSTFNFIPTTIPDTFLMARGEEGEEDSQIVDSGYFEEFNFMSAPSNVPC